MNNAPFNGYPQVPYSVGSAPGFVRVVHPEVNAEVMQQLFVGFVAKKLGLQLQVTKTPNGSQLSGRYGGLDQRVLFSTTRAQQVPFMVFGEGESIIYETASGFTASSVPEKTPEIERMVQAFGMYILNNHEETPGHASKSYRC